MAGTDGTLAEPAEALTSLLSKLYRRVRAEHREVCELRDRLTRLDRRLVVLARCAGLDQEEADDPPPVPKLERILALEERPHLDEVRPGGTAHGRWTGER